MAAHSYWRLNITTVDYGEISIAAIQMRGSIGGANLCSGGIASATSTFSGTASDAFDANIATIWIGSVTCSLIYQFSSPVNIVEYLVAGDFNNTQSGVNWTFDYSDNGIDWIVADTRTGLNTYNFGLNGIVFAVPAGANNYSITGDVTVSVLPQGVMAYITPPTSNWAVIHNVAMTASRICSSSDGTKIARLKSASDLIYISLNSGASWNSYSLPMSLTWSGLDCSDDFSTIVVSGSNYIFISTDYGQTWSQHTFSLVINCISCSGNGASIYAGTYGDTRFDTQLYITNDSAVTWLEKNPCPNTSTDNQGGFTRISAVNLSTNGLSAFIKYDYYDGITYKTIDSGDNFYNVNDDSPAIKWCVADDFQTIYRIGIHDGVRYIEKSLDSGQTWVAIFALALHASYSISCSSDGKSIAVTAYNGRIYYSQDYGVSFQEEENTRLWTGVSVSSVYAVVSGGYLYSRVINMNQETITFSSPLSFNVNVTTAYHETISFSGALDFNVDRGFGNFLGIAYGTENGAITTFDNMPFEFACNFNGKTLFANENGLFEYGGTTDNGTPVVASIKTDKSNKLMGQGGLYPTQHRKHLPTSKVYLNVEASETLNLNVTVDSDTYAYTDTSIKTGMAVHPVKVGRGLDGVHWQLEVENFETLESIEFEPVEIRRRGK